MSQEIVNDLLKPRYRVIADYPGNKFLIGEIFIQNPNGSWSDKSKAWASKMMPNFDKYPHLFIKLDWWEYRKTKEMPEYLKSHNKPINHESRLSNCLIRCGQDEFWNSSKFTNNSKGFVTAYGGIMIECFNPATREEYETYQNKIKK